MMKKCWLVLLTSIIACSAQAQVKVNNGHFTVDGNPFTVNGMAYAPEPRGWPPEPNPNSYPPTKRPQFHVAGKPFVWLCSGTHAQSPNEGDWGTACYDDDLIGQLVDSGDGVNQQYNAALQSRWKHDLDDMQQMGVNTLRLYNINNNRKTHTAFLDELNKRNMKVIYAVLTDYAATSYDDVTPIVDPIIKETCNKPAVIAYTVGNELDVAIMENPNSRQARAVRKAAERVHLLCPGKPTTYAAVDDPKRWALNDNNKSPILEAIGPNSIDIITVNAGYRGDGKSNGSKGAYKNLFKNVKQLTKVYNKPFLVGEVGVHDNDDSKYDRHWFNYVWNLILKRSAGAVNPDDATNNIGAVYFEYNDEPLKKTLAGKSNDSYMGVTTGAWPGDQRSDPNFETNLLVFTTAGDLANIKKTAGYTGIKNFWDGQKAIKFEESTRGAGRWEMFINDGTGINACSYKSSPNPQQISPECVNASR